MRLGPALVLVGSLLAACGGPPDDPMAPSAGGRRASLQPDGSIRFALTTVIPDLPAEPSLSAPLIADMTQLQHYTGASYPKTPAEQLALAQRVVYVFSRLLP